MLEANLAPGEGAAVAERQTNRLLVWQIVSPGTGREVRSGNVQAL